LAAIERNQYQTTKKLIIIPAYNESGNLPVLVDEIKRKAPGYDYVIINDGSTDRTTELCEEQGFHVINLPTNLGIGGAVQTGYRYAKRMKYDIAIQLDGDGQHDPGFLDVLIAPLLSGKADFVIGSRFIEREGFQSSKMRRAGISWLGFFIRMVSGVKISDVTSGFRAANKKVIDSFCAYYPYDYPEPETVCLLSKGEYRIEEIAVQMRERNAGRSSIRLFKTAYYMVKVTLAILITSANKKK